MELYYTPPSDKLFDEMKRIAICAWYLRYSDEHGYVTEKVSRIENLENIGDNFMYIFAMFDPVNQAIVRKILSKQCNDALNERLSVNS